ncbi:MAG: HEAT repeat domain-containing protein [Verrucomicrobia bacterium]|nr:HEAT repeat domain-containing protein [Verrucomicrobiota bacterium]
MKLRTSVIMAALGIVLALPLQAADLTQLIADVAKYESGQNAEPLRKFEQLLRDSGGKPAQRAELEAALIKLLAPSATFEARRFACQQLAVIGTDASLPALAELLKKEETVGIACLALGSQRSPKAAETLRNALPAARGRARLQLISALGNQQDKQSVKAISELARDSDATLASAAIVALGKIGSAEAHAAIAALRKEAKPAVAFAVAEATLRVAEQLAAAGDHKAAASLDEEMLASSQPANIRRGAFGALLRLDKDGGEKRISETLHGQDALLKPIAIAAVGPLKSSGASKKFAAELPKLTPQQQTWMIEALATRGDATARGAIRNAAGSSEATVRSAAVAALGRLNDGASASLLCAALAKAPDAGERQEIAAALGQLRGPAADKAIFAELKRASGDAKRELIGLAGRRGNHAAVPALLDEAGSDDAATAKAVFQALGKLAVAGDLPVVLERLVGLRAADVRSDAESAAARVMQKIADAEQRTDLVMARMAKCSDIEGRCSLLRLLPAAGDAKALATLKAAVADKEPAIREAAVRTLAAWPDVAAWDMLMAVCRQPETDTLRALALRGLVRLAGDLNAKPDAALIKRYGQLLGLARNADERKLVLGALAGAASPDALQLAVAQLSIASVRAEAAEAVKKIAAAIKGQHPQAAQEALNRLKTGK